MAQPLAVILDPVLHQPVRTRIVAYLATRGGGTFSELKAALGVTDGNLEAHIKKLVNADYISVHKESGDGRPQTLYALTTGGHHALNDYVGALQQLLQLEIGD